MRDRAIASKDSKIEIVDIEKRESVFSLTGHQGEVVLVSFDPLGEYLCSISVDATLRIWNMSKRVCESCKPGLRDATIKSISCSWTDSGSLLAVPFGNTIQLIQVVIVLISNV